MNLLRVLGCLFCSFMMLEAANAAPAGPNIIFILAGDIGLPGFSCTGGIYPTPNIDALAKGGSRFETCFAAPLCAPSRALLMTGVLGGFTTFSAFANETVLAWRAGAMAVAAANVVLSVALCIAGVAIGRAAVGLFVK